LAVERTWSRLGTAKLEVAEMEPYTSDFFNNAAAVSVALLFTKIVAHRLRSASRSVPIKWRVAHILAVISAAVALTFALLISYQSWLGWHWWVGAPLAISGGILILDEVVYDLCEIQKKKKQQ
jgi:hypothetical protein